MTNTVGSLPVGSIVTIGNGKVHYVVVAHSPSGSQVQIKKTTTKDKSARGGWWGPRHLTLVLLPSEYEPES